MELVLEADPVKKRLRSIVQSGRLAHAYLLSGPRGGLQLSMARWFAKLLVCVASEAMNRPCNQCNACARFEDGNYPDVSFVQPDGATIKIGQIRELHRAFSRAPLEASHRIYIIEDADCLTLEAANSLLKFLEEPIITSVALLTTSRTEAVLPTIRSRCQLLSIGTQEAGDIVAELMERGVEQPIAEIASEIGGTVEHALALCQDEVFADLLEAMLQLSDEMAKDDSNPMLTVADRIIKPGFTSSQIETLLDLLVLWCRDLIFRIVGIGELFFKSEIDRLSNQSSLYNVERLLQVIRDCWDTKNRLRSNANAQLSLERLVLRVTR